MHAVVSRLIGPSAAGFWPGLAAPLLLGLAAVNAWGLDENAAVQTAMANSPTAGDGQTTRPQVEISAISLPRFDNLDGVAASSRLDLRWLPPRSAFGLSLAVTSINRPLPYGDAMPSLDVGLHWRYSLDGDYRVDVTAWRRLAQPDALSLVVLNDRDTIYGARIEMQMDGAPRTGLIFDRSLLGFQLESGARITVRRKGGKPMLYYRTRF